jgi:hypothetical protein
LWSSNRIRAQLNDDSTQTEKAQMMVQKRDSSSDAGSDFVSIFLISSICNEVVIARVSRFGFFLDMSPSQFTSSLTTIKDVELQRTLVILQRSKEKVKEEVSTLSSSVIAEAKELSVDLEEEEQQGSRSS